MRYRTPETIAEAILNTVAYADVFDYPVTLAEIHRYLIGIEAPLEAVEAALGNGLLRNGRLEAHEGMFTLPGRGELVELRRRRAKRARRLWPQAIRYGRWIAHLPFVRMVAVTGALTASNVDGGADLDYLIVTQPGFLWVCRALILALARLTAPFGARVCPNYLLTTDVLELPERDLFTAQELMRMVPISGIEVYQAFRECNGWACAFLPNSAGAPGEQSPYEPTFTPLRTLGEAVLASRLGRRLEGWEMSRKIAKLSKQAGGDGESVFSAQRCKGHFDRHGARTMAVFTRKISTLRGA